MSNQISNALGSESTAEVRITSEGNKFTWSFAGKRGLDLAQKVLATAGIRYLVTGSTITVTDIGESEEISMYVTDQSLVAVSGGFTIRGTKAAILFCSNGNVQFLGEAAAELEQLVLAESPSAKIV
jgi:hypothetical protein